MATTISLVDTCEPLFQQVCRLSRGARKGVSPEMTGVRAELAQTISEIKQRCVRTGLGDQFAKIELVLWGFADSMIQQSGLSWASSWQAMAPERGGAIMDEQFFDLLDDTLKDQSEAATERLAVFYTCLGLGFTGWYSGQPEELRKKMRAMASRLAARVDTDRAARLCRDAYDTVDRRNLFEPPARVLTKAGIVVGGLVICVLAANIGLFKDKRDQMKASVLGIVQKERELLRGTLDHSADKLPGGAQ